MNRLVAKHLSDIATLFQIKGDKWRGSACSRAAEQVERFGDITEQNVTEIPGVGKGLGNTILEFMQNGTSEKYKKLAKEVDPQCLTMLVVKGVGPKGAWKFYKEGIKNFDQLVKAWEKGKLDPRFDEAMRQAISRKGARVHQAAAQALGEALLSAMKRQSGVIRISLAGSVRRQKETSKDLDLLISAKPKDRPKLIKAFTKLGKVINEGDTKASIWFELGSNTIQADLLVIPDSSFGAALAYFTGPKEHNIKLRTLAMQQGLKLNEKGIFRGSKKLGGKEEQDVYDVLGIEMPQPIVRS